MKLPNLSKLKWVYRSVFTKLFIISLTTWVLILVAVIAAFVISRKDSPGPFHRNFNNYFQYIIEDLGSPPEKNKAVSLFQETGIHISFTDNHTSWTTRQTFPDIKSINFRPFHNNGALQVGHRYGHHFLQQKTEYGTFIFDFAEFTENDSRHQKTHLILLLLLSAILLGCYFALKKVLLPLKWLKAGVLEVADGNLSYVVPVKGKDELEELGRGFNEMTARLKKIMETKEHLLRDVSHELRSPLTRMKVALELIDDNEIKGEIQLDIEQMEKMIAAILDTARVRHDSYQPEKKPCDLNDILISVTGRYKNMTPTVVYNPLTKPININADQNSLKTVVANLIDNGLKFSKEDSPPLEVALEHKSDIAIVTVTDHGSGIDETELPFIFEPFYRADKSRAHGTGGFGLGLSLCKAIIEAHGGTLQAKSTVGIGTQMILSLPLVQ